MKVYKFFKIPDENDRKNTHIEERYPLYAITNDKELAKRFKHDRNMKKFIYKKHTQVTREEYIEMCNIYRGAVLESHKVTTIFKNQHTKENAIEKEILMTYNEYQMLDTLGSYLEDDVYWQSVPFPLIFKKKYVKMLKDFEYITFYSLMNTETMPYHLAEKLSKYIEDYSGPSILFDEAARFITIISDTL